MTIADETWRAALRLLGDARHVALACHVGPDGDALGSMLALALVLRRSGVETVASWGEPFAVPKQYAFLPGLGLLSSPERFPAEPHLMVTFDAASLDRLGSLQESARRAGTLLVVDHHASNAHFGHVNLVDPDAAASAVLVYELARRLGTPLDADIATCIYTGLVTDTGSFKYSNTTPFIHEIAADLLRHGVAHAEVARAVFDTHPLAYLRLAADALARVRIDDGIVWTWITQRDLREHHVEIEDTDALIDVVRTAAEAEVACVLKEAEDGRYRVSIRSKGRLDVGRAAEALGGGGHAYAAGFTAPNGDPHAAVRTIAAALSGTRPAS